MAVLRPGGFPVAINADPRKDTPPSSETIRYVEGIELPAECKRYQVHKLKKAFFQKLYALCFPFAEYFLKFSNEHATIMSSTATDCAAYTSWICGRWTEPDTKSSWSTWKSGKPCPKMSNFCIWWNKSAKREISKRISISQVKLAKFRWMIWTSK